MVLLPNPITFSVGKLQALILKTLGITFLAFGLSFVLMQPFSFSAASLLSSADGNDFTINDFYNKVADSRHVTTLDSNIVIVDIAACDREGIAEIIETVSLCIIRKSKNPAKPKRKVQNPAKIGENHNSKRLLKYKSRNIGMIKKSIGSQANPMLFLHINHATL